jgi:two-component system sensor histidine kinase KdpD
MVVVVAAALLGGFWPGMAAAVAGFLLLNYYFTEPYHTFVISHPDDVLALTVFVVVAAAVSAVVGLAARRTVEAARAGADAEVLFNLAGNVLRGEHAVTALLDRLRETFGQESVTLLEHRPGTALTPARQRDPASWQVAATVGGQPCTTPDEGDTDIPVGEELALVLRGRPLPAADRRILEAFAAQAAAALRQQRLEEEAVRTRPLAEADKMRTALLSAVSHDLRTPLASARAAVDSLASPDITWTGDERAELVATAKDSLERLDRLVANLLDMSRLQAGALGIRTQPLALEEVIPLVLDDLGPQARHVGVSLPGDLPEVLADPALLERILVNLAANAVRYNPAGEQVLLTASSYNDRVEVRIADRGPGIPPEDRDRVFQPFQRLGDRDNHAGVGLGLALARGLTEAMDGTLVPDDTPGGGLTMILTVPAAPAPAASEAAGTVPGDQAAHPAITSRTGTWRGTSRRGAAS